MACEGGEQHLLVGLLDTTAQTNQLAPSKKRRFRRCRSAPLADFVPPESNGNAVRSLTKSIFQQAHPSFLKVASFMFMYLVIGATCFYFLRNQIIGKKTNAIVDSVYFCILTMSTAGYGDLTPNSPATKLLACAFVFSGMAIVALILSKAADYLVEKQEILLVKAMHIRHKVDSTKILQELESNKVRYKCVVLSTFILFLIVVGVTFLVAVEKLDFVDAFYCVCSTVTTLGYGAESFSTEAGRVFGTFWILTGTVCVAMLFFYIAELSTENRQRALANWVLTRKTTTVDLEAADIDDDGVVGPAEFIIYKLKEMGKISQEDISLVMEEFEKLDVDDSGTLSASDIMQSQEGR